MWHMLLGVGENYDVASRLFKPIFDTLTSLSTSNVQTTATTTHIVSPTCPTCKQQQTRTPSQYTPMTYTPSQPVEMIFAADMKMMRINL